MAIRDGPMNLREKIPLFDGRDSTSKDRHHDAPEIITQHPHSLGVWSSLKNNKLLLLLLFNEVKSSYPIHQIVQSIVFLVVIQYDTLHRLGKEQTNQEISLQMASQTYASSMHS